MARHGVSRYSKVWTTENTVGFNPEWRRDQVGRYCIKLSHTPFHLSPWIYYTSTGIFRWPINNAFAKRKPVLGLMFCFYIHVIQIRTWIYLTLYQMFVANACQQPRTQVYLQKRRWVWAWRECNAQGKHVYGNSETQRPVHCIWNGSIWQSWSNHWNVSQERTPGICKYKMYEKPT